MHLKIRKNTFLLKIWFVVVLLLELELFGIVVMPTVWYSLNSAGQKTLIIALTFIAVLYCANRKVNNVYYTSLKKNCNKYVYAFLIMILVVSIYTMIAYPNQTLFQTFRVWEHLLCVFMVYPLIYIYEKDNGIEGIFKILGILGMLYMILICVQAYLYNSNGTIIMNGYFATRNIGFRYNSVRLGIDYVLYLLLIYDFDCFINKKCSTLYEKIIVVIRVLLGLYITFFVQGSRAMLAAVLCGCVAVIFFSGKKKSKLQRNVFFATIAVLFLLSTDVLDVIWENIMSVTGDLAYSRTNRLGATAYFFECFIKNPFFGMGFLSDANVEYLSILKGTNQTFYLTDVGLIGVMAQMGIMGVLIYLFILMRGLKTIILLKKYNLSSKYSYVYGFLAFLLVSALTLALTDNFKIFSLPICVSVFEFVQKEIKQMSKEM